MFHRHLRLSLKNSTLALSNSFIGLNKNFHAVELEDTALASLANLIGVEEFELASTFIVVVLDADASMPLLDLTLACPEGDVYWVGAVQD